jgi:hypothetical protein
VKLTTHLQLVPRSRKCGSIYPLPHTPSWRSVPLVKHRNNFTFYRYPVICMHIIKSRYASKMYSNFMFNNIKHRERKRERHREEVGG